MRITSIANPIYSKSDHSTVDCDVTFNDGRTCPYTAAANDTTDYGVQLWAELGAGLHGHIAAFPLERQAESLRNAAISALEFSDRVSIRCLKAGIAYPEDWRAYDQSLRQVVESGTGSLPLQPDFPQET